MRVCKDNKRRYGYCSVFFRAREKRHEQGISRRIVGHSIAGAELSAAANSQPDRIGGIAYLDAAYSYAFDNGKGANAMDAQKLHGPEPPPPSGADLASFGALQKYYERVRGFRIPEAELRAEWTSTPDGRVGTQLVATRF
jgi:non-heme chloroperoxidase